MAPWLKGANKWRAAEVRAVLAPAPVAVPQLPALRPDLTGYDQLLQGQSGVEEVQHVH